MQPNGHGNVCGCYTNTMSASILGTLILLAPGYSLTGEWRSNLPRLHHDAMGFDIWEFGPSRSYKHHIYVSDGDEIVEKGTYTQKGSVVKTTPTQGIVRHAHAEMDIVRRPSCTLTITWIDSKHCRVKESDLTGTLTFTRGPRR